MPRILATASGFPPHYYSQATISAALQEIWAKLGVNTERVARLHEATTVQGRHVAVAKETYYPLKGWEGPNAIFAEVAVDLGEEVIERVLDGTGLTPADVDFLLFASTTGLAIPTIDARLINRMGFRSDLRRMPLFGLGCVAGATGVARLTDFLLGMPHGVGLLLCEEFCSLTIQKHDTSVANLIACGLFGDGAGAVLMVGDEHPLSSSSAPAVIGSRSVFFPNSEHYMGWAIRETGMELILSADVPGAAGTGLREPMESFLGEHGLKIEDIGRWICHPGGPKVIEAVEGALSLNGDSLSASRSLLERVGNVSSVSVLVILDDLLRGEAVPAGTYGLMMAMGPGFVAELVLLRW